MHLKKLAVRNFRRLRDVSIDLASDISIFVGANNSGKTAVGHALRLFTSRDRFDIHDFSAELWPDIIAFGEGKAGVALPTMEVDIWFEISANDIHRVIDLLPSLAWEGSLIGMRVAYAPIDPAATQSRYTQARQRALDAVPKNEKGERSFDPAPHNLQDFLRDRLKDEYELRHYVLDPARIEEAGYMPMPLVSRDRSGREILSGLLQTDFLHAQRHLSDGPGGARAEELSRVLSRFYTRNLEQKADDLETLRALAASEVSLNDHLKRVFEDTLKSLSRLGYPGLTNPRLVIRSALDPAQIMGSKDGARVHYALGPDSEDPDPPTLPDRYNGLGFKNLIFMVVELLDLHQQWLAIEDNRPPVHLIFIEEPEAHLHAQLQQVFIRKVMSILKLKGEDRTHYTSQVVVTTHSTHILYERGFRPIRYFRRSRAESTSTSDVLNLSVFHHSADPNERDFLERYLKLTHCDLFFADAAVLVEGNVERILLPQMIEKVAPRLQSTYLTILEIGGAFGYRFKALIEFLGLTTLIITDLDSVFGPALPAADGNAPGTVADAADVGQDVEADKADGDEDEDEAPVAVEKPGKSCIAGHPGAATSNETLLQWLPKCGTVALLWEATGDQKCQLRANDNDALVRVAYQCRTDVTWREEIIALAGRTLEEAFALENLAWCQDMERKSLQLRIPRNAEKDLLTLASRIHKRVQSSDFNKTDFALALLGEDPAAWTVPTYIAEGLSWLEAEIAPPETQDDEDEEQLVAGKAAPETGTALAEAAA
ncbi:ATP-dependent nuclease [Phreatobacter sp. AB_2022a]|uniref:ATP-dependent nuclease n=1 Tax=Phreatobacter sp. AB_2022a TaxID=3003134 RepID=UPI002286CE75|nr:AAA family ATPase [Phreatobacter sp. AB_2022a]MCZ0738565.1 AAA family ATPase [Phreatobacter sp. AB_2022a]